jgi:hypothetical protein
MKLVAITLLAGLAATPALAQTAAVQNPADQTVVATPQANPNVDVATAQADTARQNFYQDKLNAAQAQSQADSAIANRDAAQAQADIDRTEQRQAQSAQ